MTLVPYVPKDEQKTDVAVEIAVQCGPSHYDLDVTFTRRTVFETTTGYGADADGRRGSFLAEVVEDAAEDVRVSCPADAVPVAHPLDTITPALRANIQQAIDEYLRVNQPVYNHHFD